MKDVLAKYLQENSSLSITEINQLSMRFNEENLQKNEHWISQGDVCSRIGFLVEGTLRFYHLSDIEEYTVHFVLENNLFTALSSLVNQEGSRWNIQAVSDCKILSINKKAHDFAIHNYRQAFTLMENQFLKAYSNLEGRLLSMIQLNAEERFLMLFKSQPEIFNAVPLKHIAVSLGMTPETLSRLRHKLVK